MHSATVTYIDPATGKQIAATDLRLIATPEALQGRGKGQPGRIRRLPCQRRRPSRVRLRAVPTLMTTMEFTMYLRCPSCYFPCATRLDFVQHQLTHGIDMASSTLKHGVAETDDGRYYSVAEDAYSDSVCLFASEWTAQRQDDRSHAHVLKHYPDAQPKVRS